MVRSFATGRAPLAGLKPRDSKVSGGFGELRGKSENSRESDAPLIRLCLSTFRKPRGPLVRPDHGPKTTACSRDGIGISFPSAVRNLRNGVRCGPSAPSMPNLNYNSRERQGQQFEDLRATELYCPRCRSLRAVRERLLLVLPHGELHAYRCTVCGDTLGTREVKRAQGGLTLS